MSPFAILGGIALIAAMAAHYLRTGSQWSFNFLIGFALGFVLLGLVLEVWK